MPFDWNGYYTLAVELRKVNDEAKLRSATSRGYYCVFNLALAYIRNIHPNFRYSNHQEVWDRFSTITGKELVQTYGERVRHFRNKADYFDSINNVSSETTMAMMNFQFIINLLK